MSAIVRSRRAWGWHPLTDEWAARVVADAAVRPGELVLDIGAGHGPLTAHLIERAVAAAPRLPAATGGRFRRPRRAPPLTKMYQPAAS